MLLRHSFDTLKIQANAFKVVYTGIQKMYLSLLEYNEEIYYKL